MRPILTTSENGRLYGLRSYDHALPAGLAR